jgi:hypothetical protein
MTDGIERLIWVASRSSKFKGLDGSIPITEAIVTRKGGDGPPQNEGCRGLGTNG